MRYLFLLLLCCAISSAWAKEFYCVKGKYPNGNFHRLKVKFENGRVVDFSYDSQSVNSPDSAHTCAVEANRTDGETTWSDAVDRTKITFKEAFAEDAARFPTVLIREAKGNFFVEIDVPGVRHCGASGDLATKILFTEKPKQCIFR